MLFVWWALAPNWVPLFSYTLSETSQKEVIDLFSKEGVAYKINQENHSILLREEDIQAAHKLLGTNDLPKDTSSGLEVFNNSEYGLSEFAQNINYQRGMEEELARTIMRMNGVKNVRVHLTIKKDSLFEDRKQEPKASVVISFKEGVSYESSRVRGVQEIISAAVPNLPPKNVVIITDKGDIISASDSNESTTASIRAEAKYRAILTDLLDGVLGDGRYKLSINVLTDYKKRVSVKETYYPDTGGKGFLVKRKSSTRTSGDSVSEPVNTGQNSSEEEYIYSKEKSEVVYPIGDVTKISVGLVVLGSLNQNTHNAVENLIRSALGMDNSRGDTVNIITTDSKAIEETTASIPLDASEPKAIASAQAVDEKDTVKKYFYFFISLSIVLSILLILIFILYAKAKKNNRSLSNAEKQQLVSDLIKWMN